MFLASGKQDGRTCSLEHRPVKTCRVPPAQERDFRSRTRRWEWQGEITFAGEAKRNKTEEKKKILLHINHESRNADLETVDTPRAWRSSQRHPIRKHEKRSTAVAGHHKKKNSIEWKKEKRHYSGCRSCRDVTWNGDGVKELRPLTITEVPSKEVSIMPLTGLADASSGRSDVRATTGSGFLKARLRRTKQNHNKKTSPQRHGYWITTTPGCPRLERARVEKFHEVHAHAKPAAEDIETL